MHVELYFSPSDHPARQILKRIDASTYAIDLALLTFTRYDLSSAIVQRIHAGVHARGVFDSNTDANSQYPYLVQNGADIRIDQSQYLFHHKYAIFDAEHYPSDAWVVTGSYNWTNSAENRNDENVLLIQDHRIANFYLQEFAKRYSENGGRDTIVITRVKDEPLAHSYILFQNYPNPFNTATTIRYALPVEGNVRLLIYDVLGRLVRELVTKFQPAGVYTVSFDADKLPSGVYYYRLETPVGTQAKAMLLLK
jgi:phosphatidylserine/phosphatidylglycerophosphate/cardiolipin synthase-like enzyme